MSSSTQSLIYICVFNYGAIHLGLNHLQSLRKQGITNYRAYVTDQPSVDALRERGHPVEYISPSECHSEYGISGHDFGSTTFNIMSFLRYKVIQKLLATGINVWYMDIDTVVLKDLNQIYDGVKDLGVDMIFQNDVNMPCTGCMLCFPTDSTKRFLSIVENNIRNDTGDQIIVLNVLRQNPNIINLKLFDIKMFPNGLLYYNKDLDQNMVANYKSAVDEYNNDPNKDIYFVHANWMIGNDTKMAALKRSGLWFI